MPDPVPAALLGRLAVDQGWQDRGLGAALLRDAVLRVVGAAGTIGVRALLVDAISDEAKAFYEHWASGRRRPVRRNHGLERARMISGRRALAAGFRCAGCSRSQNARHDLLGNRYASRPRARLRGPFGASLPKTKFAADSALEGAGFEPVWGFFCQVVVFGLLSVLCSERESRSPSRRLRSGSRSARKGSRDRNGSKAWRLAPSGACVSQRLEA
jgi:GNAT superfamily N-acetyltransferase